MCFLDFLAILFFLEGLDFLDNLALLENCLYHEIYGYANHQRTSLLVPLDVNLPGAPRNITPARARLLQMAAFLEKEGVAKC